MGLLDGVMDAMGGKGAADIEALAGQFGGPGIQAIVSQFEQGGLGAVAQSWISSGANLPISTEQLQAVLGSEAVTKLAGSLGIDPAQVADALPGLVDHLTPNGQLPTGGVGGLLSQAMESGSLGDMLGGLLKR